MYDTAIRANVLYQMGIADTTTIHTSFIRMPEAVIVTVLDATVPKRVTHVVRFIELDRTIEPITTHHE